MGSASRWMLVAGGAALFACLALDAGVTIAEQAPSAVIEGDLTVIPVR